MSRIFEAGPGRSRHHPAAIMALGTHLANSACVQSWCIYHNNGEPSIAGVIKNKNHGCRIASMPPRL